MSTIPLSCFSKLPPEILPHILHQPLQRAEAKSQEMHVERNIWDDTAAVVAHITSETDCRGYCPTSLCPPVSSKRLGRPHTVYHRVLILRLLWISRALTQFPTHYAPHGNSYCSAIFSVSSPSGLNWMKCNLRPSPSLLCHGNFFSASLHTSRGSGVCDLLAPNVTSKPYLPATPVYNPVLYKTCYPATPSIPPH